MLAALAYSLSQSLFPSLSLPPQHFGKAPFEKEEERLQLRTKGRRKKGLWLYCSSSTITEKHSRDSNATNETRRYHHHRQCQSVNRACLLFFAMLPPFSVPLMPPLQPNRLLPPPPPPPPFVAAGAAIIPAKVPLSPFCTPTATTIKRPLIWKHTIDKIASIVYFPFMRSLSKKSVFPLSPLQKQSSPIQCRVDYAFESASALTIPPLHSGSFHYSTTL